MLVLHSLVYHDAHHSASICVLPWGRACCAADGGAIGAGGGEHLPEVGLEHRPIPPTLAGGAGLLEVTRGLSQGEVLSFRYPR